MTDYIDRQAIRDAMYHEAFETDSDMQRWDGGCWIRYKMVENVIDRLPSAEPTLYGYNIKHLCFIATLLQKENIPPKELKAMLSDIERMTHIIVDDITDTIQREIERSLSWK